MIITVFITGNYFIYRQVTKAHKKEFKAFIRTNFAKTETIAIYPSELYTNNSRISWLDNNKEILVNDKMYDIISISNAGTKVILTVVNDNNEKELMNRYKEQFNTETANHKKNNSIAHDFFGMKYLCTSKQIITLSFETNSFLTQLKPTIHSGYLSNNTPPPDFM